MTAFSFIHAADLHLDAPFRGLGVLSGHEGFAPQQVLRRATFLALERLTEACITSGADFLLLAGDVYNSADSSLRARLALRDAFVRLEEAGIGVFLAHGNHDPLQTERGAVPWPDNVHVFGSETGCRAAFTRNGGAAVALVHGVSHAGPAEARNLAATFKRKAPSPSEPDIFQIGLLHCALAGVSSGAGYCHEAYAPCTFAHLAEAELDYWALGHVHACRLFDHRGRPLPSPMPGPGNADTTRKNGIADPPASRTAAAYSGSTQGLHVNESGPHGCLLVRVDARGRTRVEGIPLAPVQWESLTLEPGPDLVELPALESLLIEGLEALAPAPPNPGQETTPVFPPQTVAVRVILAGQSPLHAEFAHPDSVEELRLRLGRELAPSGIWIRDMDAGLTPVIDLDAARLRPDFAGEVLRLAAGLEGDALLHTASKALDPLFKRPRLRKDSTPPEPEELAALVNEAALLCLDLLGPNAEAAEEA